MGTPLSRHIARNGLFTRIPIPLELRVLEPEILLGRSVIDRAVLDTPKDPEALAWFSLDDEDFLVICEIAHLIPQDVIEKQREVTKKLIEGIILGDLL